MDKVNNNASLGRGAEFSMHYDSWLVLSMCLAMAQLITLALQLRSDKLTSGRYIDGRQAVFFFVIAGCAWAMQGFGWHLNNAFPVFLSLLAYAMARAGSYVWYKDFLSGVRRRRIERLRDEWRKRLDTIEWTMGTLCRDINRRRAMFESIHAHAIDYGTRYERSRYENRLVSLRHDRELLEQYEVQRQWLLEKLGRVS